MSKVCEERGGEADIERHCTEARRNTSTVSCKLTGGAAEESANPAKCQALQSFWQVPFMIFHARLLRPRRDTDRQDQSQYR